MREGSREMGELVREGGRARGAGVGRRRDEVREEEEEAK